MDHHRRDLPLLVQAVTSLGHLDRWVGTLHRDSGHLDQGKGHQDQDQGKELLQWEDNHLRDNHNKIYREATACKPDHQCPFHNLVSTSLVPHPLRAELNP